MIHFRSILAGFAALLVTAFLECVTTIIWISRSIPGAASPAGTDVGWDLVPMWHESPHKVAYLAIALAGFAVGFLLAHRLSSRAAGPNKPVAR